MGEKESTDGWGLLLFRGSGTTQDTLEESGSEGTQKESEVHR